ncbi:MAG: hypothetical protein JSV96_02635 [Candidatus Aminicenantes bacterium]|nr:MAG: hypothetical protein JSV96_02635 [Candidatus Aminicenantes bacterium]
MKFNVIRLGCTLSAVWGLIVLLSGTANLIWTGYAAEFLKIIDSVYPGYHYGQWGFGGVVVATLYAVIDAWVVGVVFALLYNRFTKSKRE